MSLDFNLLSKAWKSAGEELDIKIDTPYIATTNEGKEVVCIAHLPDFGSPNGMVLGIISDSTCDIDISVKQIAKKQGKYYSFINPKIYGTYDPEIFKEALADWGFWGEERNCPSWLQ